MITLTVLMMFISGHHEETYTQYATMEECRAEGKKAMKFLIKNHKSPEAIDVIALCNGDRI